MGLTVSRDPSATIMFQFHSVINSAMINNIFSLTFVNDVHYRVHKTVILF